MFVQYETSSSKLDKASTAKATRASRALARTLTLTLTVSAFALTYGLREQSARAQAPGSASYRTQAQKRQEFIGKLRRDIAKVAHSIEVTNELIGRSRGAPYLPDIMLRLAELYIEQARYEFYLVHEERGEDAKGSAVAPTAKLLKEKAVETYIRVLDEYPQFKDNDKILFFLAHEYRELGEYEKMVGRYEELVSKHPKSSLVMDAYVVLGDYRFDKQDLAGAKSYYQKILDAPENPTQDMAHFKMGWVYLNETDYKEALHHFEAAVSSNNDPDQIGSRQEQQRLINVKREALIDLAYAYTEVHKPKGAIRYFKKLATSRQMYLLALAKLANRYFVKQDFIASAAVYREIAKLSHDAEQNLDFTGRIYESTKTSRNYGLVHQDVAEMLSAVDDYRFDWRYSETERRTAAKDFEVYTRDLVTRAQAAALRTKNAQLLPRVALAYAEYLDSFPSTENTKDVVANLADTLFEAKLYLRAGDRYEESARVVGDDPKGKEEALYNACVAFRETLQNTDKLSRFERIWAQNGLIKNGLAYVELFPGSPKVAELKLNIGRSYYEAGDFDKAIGVFNEFLTTYKGHKDAMSVADLILDSYAQQQKFDQLAARARELANSGLGDESFRRRMLSTAEKAEGRQIGEVILTASVNKTSQGSAGDEIRKYWANNKNSPMAERALYTAFVQYKESRDYDKTFETGNQFIGAYPNSQYLGDVFGTLASLATQTGDFEKATVYLEEYYKRFPSEPSAQKMLAQAGVIKRLIGDHRGAILAFQELVARGRDRAARSDYASKMLASYESLNDWEGMQRAAKYVLSVDPKNVKAHLMLGLAAEKSGNLEAATQFFQQAMRAAGRSSSDEEADDAARAAFLAGDSIFKQFDRVRAEGDVGAAAERKAGLLQALESAMGDAVGYNRGTWAVAALHRIALAYGGFASFLENAPVPQGMSANEVAQYKSIVGQQVRDIRSKSDEYFAACVEKARELNVFNGAVLGCASKGAEQTVPAVSRSNASAPPRQRYDELRAALTKNPSDLDAIAELSAYFLANGEPAKAKLTASRGAEIDERDGRFPNQMGMADLMLGDIQSAFLGFQRAVDLRHPYAAANAATLMVQFNNAAGAKSLVRDLDVSDIPTNAPDLHPEAIATVRRLQQ